MGVVQDVDYIGCSIESIMLDAIEFLLDSLPKLPPE